MKRFMAMVAAVALSVAAFGVLTGCVDGSGGGKTQGAYANAYVTVDINPSVEIITGEDGLVARVTPLNDDARLILTDTDFTGKTVEETVKQILALAKDTGYITAEGENAVLVTAQAGTAEGEADLEAALSESVQEFVNESKVDLNYLKATEEAAPQLVAEAKALGVTFGKYKLIKTAMKYDKTLTAEAAAQMPVKDLNKIVIQAREERAELLSDEAERKYDALEEKLDADSDILEIKLTADAMDAAEDAAFSEFVTEETDAAALRALYRNYADELEAAGSAEPQPDAALDELKAQVEAYKAQEKDIKAQIKALDKEQEDYREQRKALREELERVRDAREDAEDGLEDAEDEHEDADDALDAVEEKYEEAFEVLGIDMEELEELFEDEVDRLMADHEQAAEAQLDALKAQLKADTQALKEALRAEKELLKELYASEQQAA